MIVLHCRGGGRLVCVDCAGTERRADLADHTADRMRETMDISMSWHSLKEVPGAAAASGWLCVQLRCNRVEFQKRLRRCARSF